MKRRRLSQDGESLAAWGVIGSLLFLLRSPALAYNEVVVALLDEKNLTPTYVSTRIQTTWLANRARPALDAAQGRDLESVSTPSRATVAE